MASFTVEATFVVSITIWVLVAVCYLSVYSHDQTVLYSLAENYLERSVENGKEMSGADIQSGLEKYLRKHLLLYRIDRVSVKKKLLSVNADIEFHAEVQFPLANELLSASRGAKRSLSHEVLFAPAYMWDSEEIKDVIG